MFRNLILFGSIAMQPIFAQVLQPIQGGDHRFETLISDDHRGDLSQRSFGTYYMDYLEYDRNGLNSTINNGVYGNLCFSTADTSYGVIPFVAEYYNNIVLSQDLDTWRQVAWADVLSFQVDSVFIKLNVDNSSGNPCKLKMKIVDPNVISGGGGNWYEFHVPPLWEDSLVTSADIGTHSPTSISFATVGFDVGLAVSGKFAVVFEFSGSLADTCRLMWSYPTNGVACSNGSVSPPNKTPVEWDYYPTSFYSICTGGTGLEQNLSVGFPRVTGSKGFAYYVDCSNPSTPYVSDVMANGFDGNKNNFQHWNIWGVVTVLDQVGVENQASSNGLKLFPNPASGEFNIHFEVKENGGDNFLYIHDVTGKLVYAESMGTIAVGPCQRKVHPSLKEGTYFLSIRNGSGVSCTRFTVTGTN